MNRSFYIDNLRIALTVLVIFHHTAIAYGASGGWCYITPDTIKGAGQIALSSILAIDQAFFMSLFFFISACLMPDSYDKKGFGTYLKDRFVRLGIPLLVYSLLIHPCLLYGIQIHTNSNPGNLLVFVWMCITKYPNTAHMWFVLALLIFESIYAFYRRFSKVSISKFISEQMPTHRNIAIFILAGGILAFIMRLVYPIGGKNIIGLQIGYFVLYSIFYVLGIIANRKKWLEKLSFNQSIVWFLVALAFIPFIVFAWISVTNGTSQVVQYIGGFYWNSFFLAIWEAILCLGFSYFLITAFRKYLNRTTKTITNFSADSYTVYIIHPVIVVAATMLFEPVNLAPFVKFVIACIVSISTCYLFAHYFRKIPGIKRIL